MLSSFDLIAGIEMIYRKEIDGLRALAVIPVIFFHAGIQAFSGGFVGVDVFFVISGYLITSIILAEMQKGTFSVINFYERRARRILPALFFVMFACLPFAWFWLLPEDMKNFSQSLVAVSVFSSNILFYLTTGYFLPAAELKPLLHTWSLAVEEQYYVLFPLLLMFTWKLGKRWVITILIALAVISLAAAEWLSSTNVAFNFFLLPTRAWELLIGVFAAFFLFNKKTDEGYLEKQSAFLSLLGLALLTYSIFNFSGDTPFPSIYSLVPTTGTALIILFASPKNIVGQLLGNKILVGIGLISYSAYLWHQPLFAFAKHKSLEDPSKGLLFLLAIISLGLAYLTWKFIETPFRSKQRYNRTQIFSMSALGTLFFIVCGFAGQFSNGFDYRLSVMQKKIAAYSKYDGAKIYRSGTCFLSASDTHIKFSKECSQVPDNKKMLLIWGDSYAAAMSSGLRKLDSNVVQYTMASCPPIIDDIFGENCSDINRFVIKEIERLRPNHVYLHANWHTYKSIKSLKNTIALIRQVSTNSNILLIGSVPQWKPTLPVFLNKKNIGMVAETYIRMPSFKELQLTDADLEVIAKNNGAHFISVLSKICIQESCPVVIKSDKGFTLSAWDNGHMTEEESLLLAKQLIGKTK